MTGERLWTANIVVFFASGCLSLLNFCSFIASNDYTSKERELLSCLLMWHNSNFILDITVNYKLLFTTVTNSHSFTVKSFVMSSDVLRFIKLSGIFVLNLTVSKSGPFI